ncbi:MAG: MBL fold metallo-hydrolase [Thaumarchaeota archaeon]|nr:MBL fold metallo-hydrolase [Nitrososphaerota archaeon]
MPYLRQIYNEPTSCASYVLGCPTAGICAVVDPKENASEYIRIGNEKDTKITHVIETHIHADHISGARKLSKLTGAKLYLHRSADVKFDYEPLEDNQLLGIGNAKIKVIFTPGHTPESISLLYIDKTRSNTPWAALTGDTLFIGDIGRLDLVGAGTPRQMHESIFKKLLTLEDFVEIYPAHYAGSVCGKGMSPKTVSTIGYERRFNRALTAKSLGEFVRFLETNKPKPFPEHKKIKEKNAGYRN